jgi:hypothetical protein
VSRSTWRLRSSSWISVPSIARLRHEPIDAPRCIRSTATNLRGICASARGKSPRVVTALTIFGDRAAVVRVCAASRRPNDLLSRSARSTQESHGVVSAEVAVVARASQKAALDERGQQGVARGAFESPQTLRLFARPARDPGLRDIRRALTAPSRWWSLY